MTRTRKWLLTALAGMFFTGVAVGAEVTGTPDRMSFPEPILEVAEPYDGQALVENEFPGTEPEVCAGYTAQVPSCDDHLVITQ